MVHIFHIPPLWRQVIFSMSLLDLHVQLSMRLRTSSHNVERWGKGMHSSSRKLVGPIARQRQEKQYTNMADPSAFGARNVEHNKNQMKIKGTKGKKRKIDNQKCAECDAFLGAQMPLFQGFRSFFVTEQCAIS